MENVPAGILRAVQDQEHFWDKAHKDSIVAAYSTKQTGFAEEAGKVLAPESKVLDLGCGEGNDSIYFAKQGHKVVATDVAESIIDKNNQRYNHPGLSFVRQDASQPFAFPDALFDAV